MDSRAVKLILAAFLFIAFVTPFFRLSVAMPKKGKDDSVPYVKLEPPANIAFRPATLALVVATERVDSTKLRVSDIGH
jgi:hypothetical protein